MERLIGQYEAITRRQEARSTYALNGAVYVADAAWIRETESFLSGQTQAYVMPRRKSADVDAVMDLAWCEVLKKQFPPQG